LAIGRYSGVEGDLHAHSPDWLILWALDPRFGPSSSAEEVDRCDPNEVGHQDILRLRDELAILSSSLLLDMICHIGEAYPKSLFAQSQWATPPR